MVVVQVELDAYHVEDQKGFRDEDQAQDAQEDVLSDQRWRSSVPLGLRYAMTTAL